MFVKGTEGRVVCALCSTVLYHNLVRQDEKKTKYKLIFFIKTCFLHALADSSLNYLQCTTRQKWRDESTLKGYIV